MSHVSLGRPEFVPGTPPGHPTAKFLYVIFLYRFFSLHTLGQSITFRPLAVSEHQKNFRKAPGTFNFLRHVMRAILSVRPKCSHRCVSLKETLVGW